MCRQCGRQHLDGIRIEQLAGDIIGSQVRHHAKYDASGMVILAAGDCSATLTVSVAGLVGVVEGERAGFARVFVAGVWCATTL
jgi:hypothetical protein